MLNDPQAIVKSSLSPSIVEVRLLMGTPPQKVVLGRQVQERSWHDQVEEPLPDEEEEREVCVQEEAAQ